MSTRVVRQIQGQEVVDAQVQDNQTARRGRGGHAPAPPGRSDGSTAAEPHGQTTQLSVTGSTELCQEHARETLWPRSTANQRSSAGMGFSDMFGQIAPALVHQQHQANTAAFGKFDQCRYWERPSVHYSVNGFNTRTRSYESPPGVQVTTVRSWISAVAAICLSKAFSGCGTLRRPHSCAISVSISNIKSRYSLSSASNPLSNRSAWRRRHDGGAAQCLAAAPQP